MLVDQLLEEAQHLARPCTLLVPQADTESVAAIWGGPGIVLPSGDTQLHRITIDCRFLPSDFQDLAGCMSVYYTEDDQVRDPVRYDTTATLPTTSHPGINLYPQRTKSLPPIEALFRFGSPVIQDWLLANRWQPDWEYNDNFPDRAIANAYNRIYQAQNPFYTGAAFAVLGGWHFPWPDGDWDDLLQQRLIIWTFEDAEPWLEVWRTNNDQFQLKARIT
jgi:hypothetical protein